MGGGYGWGMRGGLSGDVGFIFQCFLFRVFTSYLPSTPAFGVYTGAVGIIARLAVVVRCGQSLGGVNRGLFVAVWSQRGWRGWSVGPIGAPRGDVETKRRAYECVGSAGFPNMFFEYFSGRFHWRYFRGDLLGFARTPEARAGSPCIYYSLDIFGDISGDFGGTLTLLVDITCTPDMHMPTHRQRARISVYGRCISI